MKVLVGLALAAFSACPGRCGDHVPSGTEVRVVGNELFIHGTLDHETKPLITNVLDQNSAVDTIVFTVNPGSVDDECTIELGREIRRRGIDTRLVEGGVLVSGGLTLFLAGVNRTVEGAFTIGVHSWQRCSEQEGKRRCRDASDFPAEDPAHRLHGDYIEEMLGSEEFYWFSIDSAPSRAVYWMGSEEIESFGIAGTASGPRLNPVPVDIDVQRLRSELCRNCPPLPQPTMRGWTPPSASRSGL